MAYADAVGDLRNERAEEQHRTRDGQEAAGDPRGEAGFDDVDGSVDEQRSPKDRAGGGDRVGDAK